jgi:hypothetical protein
MGSAATCTECWSDRGGGNVTANSSQVKDCLHPEYTRPEFTRPRKRDGKMSLKRGTTPRNPVFGKCPQQQMPEKRNITQEAKQETAVAGKGHQPEGAAEFIPRPIITRMVQRAQVQHAQRKTGAAGQIQPLKFPHKSNHPPPASGAGRPPQHCSLQ